MPRQIAGQTRLERIARSAGGTLTGFRTGSDGRQYARIRSTSGRVTQVPLGGGRGGGAGSMGG